MQGSNQQWRHQWGHRGHTGNLSPQSEALPPLAPSQKEKLPKISHFQEIFGFFSPCILPLGAPNKKKSGSCHWVFPLRPYRSPKIGSTEFVKMKDAFLNLSARIPQILLNLVELVKAQKPQELRNTAVML